MSSGERPTFLAASGGYYAGQLFVMLAGFISLPITTRLLSKDEYGALSLIFATVAMAGILGRLGFAQATTRFYAEVNRRGKEALRHFCETMLTGAMAASVCVAAAIALYFAWWNPESASAYARCVQLACVLVVVRVTSAVLLEMYRAPERVSSYTAAKVVARYAALALSVALLLLYRADARSVVLATVIAESLVGLACLVDLARRGHIRSVSLSWPSIRTATAYGTPLTLAGSGRLILQYGDRFLIECFLSIGAVATYSVPYDLAMYLGEAVFAPLRAASIPVIFRTWAEKGPEETSRFGSELASYAIAIAIPVFTLFLLTSKALILLLASSRYLASASLLPIMLPGIALDQLSFLLAWGLRVNKETTTAAVITLSGGALNVGLNLMLIPYWGLEGAAVATTVAYAWMSVALYWKTRDVLGLRLRYWLIGKSVVATGVMAVIVVAISSIGLPPVLDIMVRGGLGAVTAATCMIGLEPDVRNRLSLWLRPRTARLEGSAYPGWTRPPV